MTKHILYIGTTLPTPGFGSSVIFYRHLKRLEGWKVSVACFRQEADKRHLLPKDWQIITLDEPKCFSFLGRRLPGMTTLNMINFEKQCRQGLNGKMPCAILNQLGLNSILAFYLSRKWRVPLNMAIHDRWQVWTKAPVDRLFMTEKRAMAILNHASRIWAVSQEMADYYSVKDSAKATVLFPMPEGVKAISNFASWKDFFKSRPVLAFAGSYHSPYAPLLRMAAESLLKAQGELIIMSKKLDFIQKEIGDYKNIKYLNSLPNVEALAFLRDNASAILIPGSIDTKAAGWQLSFPSRLVEFAHTGLPLIIVSEPGTALSNWAKQHNRLCYSETFGKEETFEAVRRITEKEEWLNLAQESRSLAEGEFAPDKIQAQFEQELVFAQGKQNHQSPVTKSPVTGHQEDR